VVPRRGGIPSSQIPTELNTGVRMLRNVEKVHFGAQMIQRLNGILSSPNFDRPRVFFLDCYFSEKSLPWLRIRPKDKVLIVDSTKEPSTDVIDNHVKILKEAGLTYSTVSVVVGIGGGSTLDTAKAVSNLMTNPGTAADYQGWDLLVNRGIYKIGVPTLFGTGAEATRTCVMTNSSTGLKLGMNSDITVFDEIICDPDLSATVPMDQYFYTAMDSFIHSFESQCGIFRNTLGDHYSELALELCEKVFEREEISDPVGRERVALASYFGGVAIAMTYVGLVHPLSAALSTILGLHHCIANCISMRAVEKIYPKYYDKFFYYAEKHSIQIPQLNIETNFGTNTIEKLTKASLQHTKPLMNAFGADYQKILTDEYVYDLFKKM
jgi:3-deoxy-alpha-D-manno-octulosonate 8-oxidase